MVRIYISCPKSSGQYSTPTRRDATNSQKVRSGRVCPPSFHQPAHPKTKDPKTAVTCTQPATNSRLRGYSAVQCAIVSEHGHGRGQNCRARHVTLLTSGMTAGVALAPCFFFSLSKAPCRPNPPPLARATPSGGSRVAYQWALWPCSCLPLCKFLVWCDGMAGREFGGTCRDRECIQSFAAAPLQISMHRAGLTRLLPCNLAHTAMSAGFVQVSTLCPCCCLLCRSQAQDEMNELL